MLDIIMCFWFRNYFLHEKHYCFSSAYNDTHMIRIMMRIDQSYVNHQELAPEYKLSSLCVSSEKVYESIKRYFYAEYRSPVDTKLFSFHYLKQTHCSKHVTSLYYQTQMNKAAISLFTQTLARGAEGCWKIQRQSGRSEGDGGRR